MSLKVYFGPYEAHGVIRHKMQKLRGLVADLSKKGYVIEVIPINRLNALIIHLMDREIYRCDIRYLMFNMSIEDDPVAQNIVKNIEDSRARFEAHDNLPGFGLPRRRSCPYTYRSEDYSVMCEIPNACNYIKK